ncbi:MAG TPA: ribose-5-phosphate isomerase RpiA [Urbifossiella sp.]|nr:ribose-5-phosphate isomerase RpiA [Urbifossiella sp.]
MTNVEAALAMVANGMTLGLGSGHAAERFIAALGARVRAGLAVRGVPTSQASAALAVQAGIPLVELADALPIDMTCDGADEVDPDLNLLKGFGHALVREKVVAAASKKFVILIGPEKVDEKLVERLGQRGQLPVEVVPFALPLCLRRFTELGIGSDVLHDSAGAPYMSDNGNHIVHLKLSPIAEPAKLERQLRDIPGVVGTGLFLNMADTVLTENNGSVEVRNRK